TIESSREIERIGTTVRVALSAALKDGLFQDLSQLVSRWQAAEPSIGFTYIDLARWQPGQAPHGFAVGDPGAEAGAAVPAYLPLPADPTRAGRLQRIYAEQVSYGEHVTIGGRPFFVQIEPIRDADDRLAGAIELSRDETEVVKEITQSRYSAVYAVAGLGLMLALL